LLIAVRHATRYTFAGPVKHGLQRLRLRPKSTQGQAVLDWTMELEHSCCEAEYEDHNHNHVTLVSIDPGATAVSVTCTGHVETSDSAGVIGHHSGHTPLWRFLGQTPLTRPGPRLRALVAGLDADRSDRLASLHALSRAVRDAMDYATGQTAVDTTAEDALSAGHGVCQDHAQAFIGAARLLGAPARYVSGYLLMDDRIEQDAGHAWAEAHVDEIGWVGFDIANRISPDERYVRVATGCDYREAAPVTGMSIGGGQTTLSVALAVEQQSVQQ
jgi:transglutaminase-like putative cysteine protease